MIIPIVTLLLLSSVSIEAAYILKDNGLIHQDEVATMSVQEHHGAELEALHTRNWQELIRQATVVIKNFPGTPFSHEAYFFLGKGYLETKEFDFANQYLTLYLKKKDIPKHFEEAMEGKLLIADQFRKGAKKHLLGMESLPKWVPAKEEALRVYDEISTAMPNHELAAKALLGKSLLLSEELEYREAVENLQTLIRRFPKHDLAGQAFLEIGHFYLKQVQEEFPDPDLLDSAEINLRKFKTEFPGDARILSAQKTFSQLQELFAENLFDTGQFFERTKKPHASLIYYGRILRDFSETETAKLAQARIVVLQPKADDPAEAEKKEVPLIESLSSAPEIEDHQNSHSELLCQELSEAGSHAADTHSNEAVIQSMETSSELSPVIGEALANDQI